VIFDRVRENMRRYKRMTLIELLNFSINETLARTFMTAGTVFVAVLALVLFGGPVLYSFSIAMLWGVIVGTYSSIFFATPLLVSLRERTELVRTHTRRVLNRRKPAKAAEVVEHAEPEEMAASLAAKPAPEKPAPGARPVRPTASRTGRPSGKRNTRR